MPSPTLILLNGTEISQIQDVFTLLERAIHFGDATFDTFLVAGGKPVNVDKHLARLNKGLDFLGLEPAFRPEPVWFSALMSVWPAMAEAPFGIVRLQFFRQGSGTYMPTGSRAGWLLEFTPLDADPRGQTGKLRLGIYKALELHPSPLSAFKSSSAMIYVLAANWARDNQLDAALLTSRGNVSDATGSNLFWVKQGILHTPPLSDACLDGVMRSEIMELATRNGIPFHEKSIAPAELKAADEIFITNAIRGIQTVIAVDSQEYEDKHPFAENLKRLLSAQN